MRQSKVFQDTTNIFSSVISLVLPSLLLKLCIVDFGEFTCNLVVLTKSFHRTTLIEIAVFSTILSTSTSTFFFIGM